MSFNGPRSEVGGAASTRHKCYASPLADKCFVSKALRVYSYLSRTVIGLGQSKHLSNSANVKTNDRKAIDGGKSA